MTTNEKKALSFTPEEREFLIAMTQENLMKLLKTKEDLIQDVAKRDPNLDISQALNFTDFVAASMQWLMNDPNVIFRKVEDENAYVVITLLRDVGELLTGENDELKISILEKVAARLQEEPKLLPHLPFSYT